MPIKLAFTEQERKQVYDLFTNTERDYEKLAELYALKERSPADYEYTNARYGELLRKVIELERS